MRGNRCSSNQVLDCRVARAIVCCLLGASPALAQDRIYFPSHENARDPILARINAETVRLDVATWYLTDRRLTSAIVARHRAGVEVRVLGDRVSIFEIDPNTRREFEYMASSGVPIRLRYFPTTFPSIMHWKAGIFVGQGIVEFGSANWTPFELVPASSTNFKDETAMFTGDPELVAAFRSRFDQFWADASAFLDWPEAYERETGTPWTVAMRIDRTRLEPTVAGPGSMVWEQGPALNDRMAADIRAETLGVDLVVYRLSNAAITDALVARRAAGVPVRVLVEPSQYRQDTWPEYWLTGARLDRLWLAGAQIKERAHAGLTHMKVLITSRSAMHGSSNFTNNWQRDHNYFIPASTRPALYNALKDEFDRMWADTANYRPFSPRPPAAPQLSSPADAASGVSRMPQLTWRRTPWAVAFDVYLGTSPADLRFQARVNAVLTETPPATYSWTPAAPLQAGTQYYWQIVARTFATERLPGLVTPSAVRSFVTGGGTGGGGGSGGGNGGAGRVLLWRHAATGALVSWQMNGTTRQSSGALSPGQASTSWRLAAFDDFNRDGHPDLLWHHASTGALTAWLMNGRTRVGTATPTPSSVDPAWRVAATGDFNGDGQTDLVWRHAAGHIGVWLMSGLRRAGMLAMDPGAVSPAWSIAGAADLNRDGSADLVWRHRDGAIGIWIMNGVRQVRPVAISPNHIHPDWRLAAVADMNGDGRPDFVWHHQRLGNLGVWLLDGVTRVATVALAPARMDPSWSLSGAR